jgi:sporulation protein YlmC with PRC-barrel domain
MKQAAGRADYVDIYREILDHALRDADDWECGTVDDIEVEGGIGGPLRITALLVGPGAWAPRLPAWAARLVPHLFGTSCVRVPWSEVSEVGEYIRLGSRAAALGLGTIERKLGLRIARLPGADKGEQ